MPGLEQLWQGYEQAQELRIKKAKEKADQIAQQYERQFREKQAAQQHEYQMQTLLQEASRIKEEARYHDMLEKERQAALKEKEQRDADTARHNLATELQREMDASIRLYGTNMRGLEAFLRNATDLQKSYTKEGLSPADAEAIVQNYQARFKNTFSPVGMPATPDQLPQQGFATPTFPYFFPQGGAPQSFLKSQGPQTGQIPQQGSPFQFPFRTPGEEPFVPQGQPGAGNPVASQVLPMVANKMALGTAQAEKAQAYADQAKAFTAAELRIKNATATRDEALAKKAGIDAKFAEALDKLKVEDLRVVIEKTKAILNTEKYKQANLLPAEVEEKKAQAALYRMRAKGGAVTLQERNLVQNQITKTQGVVDKAEAEKAKALAQADAMQRKIREGNAPAGFKGKTPLTQEQQSQIWQLYTTLEPAITAFDETIAQAKRDHEKWTDIGNTLGIGTQASTPGGRPDNPATQRSQGATTQDLHNAEKHLHKVQGQQNTTKPKHRKFKPVGQMNLQEAEEYKRYLQSGGTP